MVFHHLQASFAGGEISPSLQARADAAAYSTWLKSAKNFYVHPQGGASNRPGTAFMGLAKNTGKPCRVVPFVLSEEESYVLELGEKYLRLYTSAGVVQNQDGTALELATPYAASAVQKLNYTQYGQKLFLAHPSYPPQVLSLQNGTFTLQALPLRYGPFQSANTEQVHKLRVTKSTEGAVSAGVAATVRFQPEVYPNYGVLGYFNDVWFFSGPDYGLDLNLLVSQFNSTFGAQGLSATLSGGLLQITSPQATGGDWNGKQLVLKYYQAFTRPPVLTVTQTLSGGANQGSPSSTAPEMYRLESDFDLFSPEDVGGKFALTHAVEAQLGTGTLGYEQTSGTIKTAGDWRLRTSGTWTGTVTLESSADNGVTWREVKLLSRASGDENFSLVGQLEDTNSFYLLRVRSGANTGEAGYELQAEAFFQEGVAVLTGYIGPRQMLVDIERPFGADTWTSEWAEGSFSPKNGYPACVFFYQDRLGLAGTRAEAQTLWFSKTGAYDDFGHARTTLLDSDALSIKLSGKKLNAIHSVAVGNRLLIFTAGSEWTLSANGALTPTNFQLSQQSERGASRTAPVLVGNKALYVQARGGVLRDFYYDYNTASYTGNDLTLCARHLFFNREIVDLCYQQEPDNLLWCVLDNGTLLTLTYLAEQDLYAWTHHETQGKFASVCTVPNRGYDEVWFAVKRGETYQVERLSRRLASKEAQDQVFLDAAVSRRSETPFSEVSGLAHLEGKQVGVLADGSPLGSLTVTNGKITLPRAMHCVQVGLSYEAELQTLPAAFTLADGTGLDRKRRVVSVVVKMLDSRGGRVGTDPQALDEIVQRTDEPYNTPLPLKTTEYEKPLSGLHTSLPSVIFRQTDPLPVTVLALITRLA